MNHTESHWPVIKECATVESPPKGWKPPINTREVKHNPHSNGGGEATT
jgi:hypothetical protein